MQCGSPSQNDRLSKKLTAIEQRLEDILMRISQESGSTEACLRDLTLSIAKLTSTVTSVDQRLAGNASSFPNAPRVGTASSPRSPRSPRSENRGNRGDRGDRGDRESRMVPMKSSKTDVSAILRSDRSEILAMESQPLLDSQVDVGRKPKEAKKPKAQKYTSLNMEALGIPFQERIARAQLALGLDSKQSAMSKLVMDFLEDPESSMLAFYYSNGITIFTILGVFFSFLPALNMEVGNQDVVDFFIDLVLVTETAIRFLFHPHYMLIITGEQRFENMIDCCSAIPLILIVVKDNFGEDFGTLGDAALLAATPMIRLLRLVRRFTYMQLLKVAFREALEALPALMFIMLVMAYGFAALLYLLEPRENMPTIAHAAWLVISTITTVGFGDVVPSTQGGLVVTSILMVVSSLYMAMPLAVIGHSFNTIWANRKRILLLNKTRSRLSKWGFGPYEMPRLFGLFDLDHSDEVDLPEFKILLNEMDMGLKDREITDLFKLIDKDSGGSIDEKEFVKTLYPDEYRMLYPKRRTSVRMTSSMDVEQT